MDLEKLNRRVEVIGAKLQELSSVDLMDDLKELVEERTDIGEKILENKLKNIEYTYVEEKYVGFLLDDVQVGFVFEYGEDEDGPYYDIIAEIINLND
jgi:hypothetical protein